MSCLTRRRTSACGGWVRGDLIGKGGFGNVFKAYPVKLVKGFPAIMAVKVAEVSESEPTKVEALITEAEILSEFQDCPFVIKYYGDEWSYIDKKPITFNLLLEFAAGGTIGDRINKSGFTESEVKEFTESILKGLQFIHDKGYVHCDLKPDNILLVPDMTCHADFVAKVADFGLTKRAQDMYSRQGTAIYWPPETVLSNIQGKPSDIWALGCVVLEMLTGNLWPCKTSEHLSSWVLNPVIPSHLSNEAKDFLSNCLDINASRRFTAERLLTHSFLRQPCNESVEQVAKVSALSQSEHCHHRLPSLDWISEEAQNASKTRFTAKWLLTHSFLSKPSNESVEQVAKVSTLSQSEHCHHRLPSFIPPGDWSSEEAQNASKTRFTAKWLLTHSFLSKPSNESVEQVAKVSTLSQSEHCHHRLPSFISIGDCSSEEAQKTEEQCGLPDDNFTFPLALMSRAARPVVADTWCTKQTTFALMGAA